LLTTPDDIEVVTVEILTAEPCKICVLYNPPNSGTDYQEHLLLYVSLLMKEEDPVVIMGDFNTPDVVCQLLMQIPTFHLIFAI